MAIRKQRPPHQAQLPLRAPALQPAPQAPSGILRTCAYCMTRRDTSQLVQIADAFTICADRASCDQRAAASDLYPQRADEQALADHELKAGAIR